MALAPGGVLPIDFDHRSFAGQGKSESRAAGWISGLSVEGDRIMASVDWMPEGRKALEERAYRFISPVFDNLPSGEVVRIGGAGLVNNPALPQLRQLASQEQNMDPIKQIAGLLGIAADRPDDIVARMTALAAADDQLFSDTKVAFDAAAAACSFGTIKPGAVEYRTIQTLLNAGGFNAGAPDGILANGAPDRAT